MINYVVLIYDKDNEKIKNAPGVVRALGKLITWLCA